MGLRVLHIMQKLKFKLLKSCTTVILRAMVTFCYILSSYCMRSWTKHFKNKFLVCLLIFRSLCIVSYAQLLFEKCSINSAKTSDNKAIFLSLCAMKWVAEMSSGNSDDFRNQRASLSFPLKISFSNFINMGHIFSMIPLSYIETVRHGCTLGRAISKKQPEPSYMNWQSKQLSGWQKS